MNRFQHAVCVAAIASMVVVPAQANQTVGLFQNDPESYQGYTLFAPNASVTTYLIDDAGKLVHSWDSAYEPGLSAYLLEAGVLLRPGAYAANGSGLFNAGGRGGRVQKTDWDGTLIWDYVYSDSMKRQHHDVEQLSNGNVLLMAWEYKSSAEAIAAGRDPNLLIENQLWPDHIVEVAPSGLSGGTIVWEWHVWDHLIQDYDPTKDNYGTVADHPELIDINFVPRTGPNAGKADWNHINSVDYNPELDQIVLSVHAFSEIWIIDHSTTTEEAAGHTGGNAGRGGDLLYRWGNPRTYGRGGAEDQTLFKQHDAQWIEPGLPGASNLLIFNNGGNRPEGNYSTVDEIVPPVDEHGEYYLAPSSTYGPSSAIWSYASTPPTSFYAQNVSGAQRLPNGNTLICHGPEGTFFEVTPAKDFVWAYVNPVGSAGAVHQGEFAELNGVFRAYRYGADDPAFDGRDLTSGDPVEQFERPLPVPAGEGSTDPMIAKRVTESGEWLRVEWDSGSCPAENYNLLYGDLADLPDLTPAGAACGIGTSGAYDWQDVPAGDLFFLVVGADSMGIYESRWGTGEGGLERNPSSPSWMCGVTSKDTALTCP